MKLFTLSTALFLVLVGSSAVSAQSIRFTERRTGGELSVFGTTSSDSILVQFTSRRANVAVTVRRRTSGTLLRSASFPTRDIDFIFISGNDGNDFIRNATDFESTIRGGRGRDTIFGGDARDVIDGESGDDVIHGGADNDILAGGEGADRIFGDGGDDFIVGGRWEAPEDLARFLPTELPRVSDVHSDVHPDTLVGNGGFDVFAFESNDERVGVHLSRPGAELSVAQKHLQIWFNSHAWPRNGGFFNPVRIWQARG